MASITWQDLLARRLKLLMKMQAMTRGKSDTIVLAKMDDHLRATLLKSREMRKMTVGRRVKGVENAKVKMLVKRKTRIDPGVDVDPVKGVKMTTRTSRGSAIAASGVAAVMKTRTRTVVSVTVARSAGTRAVEETMTETRMAVKIPARSEGKEIVVSTIDDFDFDQHKLSIDENNFKVRDK